MNKQITLSALNDELAKVRTKKKEFLAQMDRIIPWGEWKALIQPYYYTIILYFGMQFAYVVRHGKQHDFRCDLFISPEQKLSKAIILLDDSESPFRLDRAVFLS